MVERRGLEQFLQKWGPILEKAGLENSRQELRFLIRESLGWEIAEQYLKNREEIPEASWQRLESLAERRSRREPFSCLFGFADFFGHRFHIAEGALAPRPETELLVELALELLAETAATDLQLAEFCCGSGAAGLSLLAALRERWPEQKYRLLLSDIDAESLDSARENSRRLGLAELCTFKQADLLPEDCSPASLDLILINPPYIPSAELAELMPEVRDYEKARCLDGGSDGLDFYRRIARELPFCLRRGGWIIMEHGSGQRPQLARIFAEQGENRTFLTKNDFSGHDRVFAFRNGDFSDTRN